MSCKHYRHRFPPMPGVAGKAARRLLPAGLHSSSRGHQACSVSTDTHSAVFSFYASESRVARKVTCVNCSFGTRSQLKAFFGGFFFRFSVNTQQMHNETKRVRKVLKTRCFERPTSQMRSHKRSLLRHCKTWHHTLLWNFSRHETAQSTNNSGSKPVP